MLAELIVAAVFAVHNNVNENGVHRKLAQTFCKAACRIVSDKALVSIVCQQNPVLVLAHAENACLLVKLDLVGLLRESPCGRASALDLDNIIIELLFTVEFIIALNSHGCVEVILMSRGVIHFRQLFAVNVNNGKLAAIQGIACDDFAVSDNVCTDEFFKVIFSYQI